MNTRSIRIDHPVVADWHGPSAWADTSLRTRYLLSLAGLVAIGLLCAFYSVVAGATHRAHSTREQLRVASERQVVCSAFSTTSSRDLCLLTMANHVPRGAVMRASSDRPAANVSRTQLTAGL